MANVKLLKCVKCGREYSPEDVMYWCPSCGIEGTLDVIYDYNSLKKSITKEKFKNNNDYSMWRYIDLLPIHKKPECLTIHTGWTPLYKSTSIQNKLNTGPVYIKDDGRNPTASLKDRASAVGVARALELNRKVMCAASTGNAASSLSGFAACASMPTYIFVPASAPDAKLAQLLAYGSNVILIDGTYDEAFDLCLEASSKFGWYNRSCAINPYLVEGKKTISFEILEQLNFNVPDMVFMSIGDGCCISGAWKGFKEMYQLGLINKLPRMVGVQSEGSNPVNRAFRKGTNSFEYIKPQTIADSISVGIPRNGLKALRALRESGGNAVDVSDSDILEAMKEMARLTGVFGEPAGAASYAGLRKMASQSMVKKDDVVVVVVSGNGLKDIKSAMSSFKKPSTIGPCMDELEKVLKQHTLAISF